jgi:nucleoside phosphorylase
MRYQGKGILGVEMEMAAAFAFGLAKKVSIGALLLVSDELRMNGWKQGFFSDPLNRTRKNVLTVLLSHVRELIPH